MEQKLYGIAKSNKRTEFILEKSQEFIKIIRKLTESLAGSSGKFFFGFKTGKFEKKDVKIKDYTDVCIHEIIKDYEFEVFIGKKRIILIVWTSLKNQEKVVKEIMKFYRWYKKS